MPVRRRNPKHRTVYPEAIQCLIAGAPAEESEETRMLLIGLAYFNDHPELGDGDRQRAMEVLAGWRDAAGGDALCR